MSSFSCAHTLFFFFFFNDTATTEIYTLSLRDALPIYSSLLLRLNHGPVPSPPPRTVANSSSRSEEHTSELQSHGHLVCLLLLEKKNDHIGLPSLVGVFNDCICHADALLDTAVEHLLANFLFFLMIRRTTRSKLFPYPTLLRLKRTVR